MKDGSIVFSVLGTRGSGPVSGENQREYGLATSCYVVETKDALIYLDAGSGMASADADRVREGKQVVVLLTHPHTDHLLGLPFLPALHDPKETVTLMAAKRGGMGAKQQVDRLYSPPLWPCLMEDLPAKLVYKDLVMSEKTETFQIGDVTVEYMEGNHPGGSTVFALSYEGKRLVYATDFEHLDLLPEMQANKAPVACGDTAWKRLVEFAKGADLILFDAPYTDAEYEWKKGFGHSTMEKAVELQKETSAGKVLISHYEVRKTDEELRELEKKYGNSQVLFTKQGMKIEL